MSAKMQLVAKLDQRLAMNQQLREAIALLQYNTVELKQLVKQYLETNPFLETEIIDEENEETEDEFESDRDHSYSLDFSKKKQTEYDEDTLENYAVPKTLRSHLLEQTWLCKFDASAQMIAEAIIDCIDDDGRLTVSIDEIATSINIHDQQKIAATLKKIQTFDPIGIAARDLRECLLLQLESLTDKNATWQLAHQVVKQFFDTETTINTKNMIKKLGVTQDDYMHAISLIRTLNPKPGLLYSSEINIKIEPELLVKKIKNEWHVFLTDSILTATKINAHYQSLLKQSKQEASYRTLHKEMQEAQWLLKGLQRRNETLLAVANYIVDVQKDFFEHGHAAMKPMNIIDVASALSVHESTISRITTGKYMATPSGVYELKFFFPSQVKTQQGDGCSATAVKSLIKEIISQELQEHVLSDEEIAVILREKGIHIARRTVAKYRESMNILPSYQRVQTHKLDEWSEVKNQT